MVEKTQLSRYPTGWWIVATSAEIYADKQLGLKRFGQDFVFWRSQDGKLHALQDLCPHRSVKLSLGRVRDNCIECPFHGFRFAPTGECTWIPETGKAAPGIRVKSYAVREWDGFVWLWWSNSQGDEIGTTEPSTFEEISEYSWSSWDYAMDQTCHVTRAIENQLDTAHLPFVHATTIGRGSNPRERNRVVTSTREIKIDLGKVPDKVPYIRFSLPNYWINVIHPMFMATLAFAPVDDGHVRLYLRTYQRFLLFPFLGKILTWALHGFNKVVLNQDKRVVESHPGGSSLEQAGRGEKLVGSDLAIREFRKRWPQADSR